MRNLARFALSFGAKVTGSDDGYNGINPPFLEEVVIKKRFSEDELTDIDLVVTTSAIPDTHEQLLIIDKLGKKRIKREEFLDIISREFETFITVSGTHGKTTTCGMLGEILNSTNIHPAVHLGGEYGNFFPFSKKVLVSEACEYKKSFLSLTPDVCIILNTEYDHPDCYKSQKEVNDTYLRFARKTKSDGVVISPYPILSGTENLVVGRDIVASKVRLECGTYSFVPVINGVEKERIHLLVPGKHNVQNALFAILVARYLKIDYSHVKSGLERFSGVNLRYTIKTLSCGKVIVDYAHHPSEIGAVLNTVNEIDTTPRVFFQPHTYSRTKAFFNQFVEVLKPCKPLYIVEEYPARESPQDGVDAYTLYLSLKDKTEAYYLTLEEAYEVIKEQHPLTLVLGAGNISQIIQ